MAKRSEELSRETNEQLSMAIARAEKAEQRAAEIIKEADERVKLQAEIIAKRSEELNLEVLASIARAKKAEQHSAEKIGEAEERILKFVERAAQMEQTFTDAMKRMKGSKGMRQWLKLDEGWHAHPELVDATSDADAQRYVPNKDHRSGDWAQWRTTEDELPDHEAVEDLVRPRAEIVESSNLMGERNADREQSEGNVSVQSDTDDDMSVVSENQGVTVQKGKGKQKMVWMLNSQYIRLAWMFLEGSAAQEIFSTFRWGEFGHLQYGTIAIAIANSNKPALRLSRTHRAAFASSSASPSA